MFLFTRNPVRRSMLVVRLTDEQHATVVAEAQRRGLSVSDLIRSLLDDGIGDSGATPRQVAEVSKGT